MCRFLHVLVLLCLLAATVVGCTGEILGPPGEVTLTPPGVPPPPTTYNVGALSKFECAPGGKATVQTPVRRLTSTQYINTMHALFDTYAAKAPALATALESGLARVPDDTVARVAPEAVPGASFETLATTMTREHNDAYFRTALVIADVVSTDVTARTALFGACATDGSTTNDRTCVENFITSFAPRVLRHPLTDDRRKFLLHNVYADTEDPALAASERYVVRRVAVRDLMIALLVSPEFLYHMGLDGTEGVGSYNVDAFARAERISYFLWNSPPDSELIALATSGALLDDAVYRKQLGRLLDDPRGREHLHEFVAEWLEFDRVDDPYPLYSSGNPQYAAFSAANPPSERLREDALREVLDGFDYHYDNNLSLLEFFISDKSFARTKELATLYATPVWSGTGEPPTFTEPERFGLLTRAAFLIHSSPVTSPIQRGAFIRRRLMCDIIAPPPPAAGNTPDPVFDRPVTTRTIIKALTGGPGCTSCHTMINGIGFPFEGFDALARVRTSEDVYDEHGTLLASLPVDTVSYPILTSGAAREVTANATELTHSVKELGYVQACLARNYLRSSIGRIEDVATDGCALEQLRVTADTGTLRDFFVSLLMSEVFLQQQVDAN